MEKGNLNAGDQTAYKITSQEKCRFHETTTIAGPGKCIMSLSGHGRLSSNPSLCRLVGPQLSWADCHCVRAEWMHVVSSIM